MANQKSTAEQLQQQQQQAQQQALQQAYVQQLNRLQQAGELAEQERQTLQNTLLQYAQLRPAGPNDAGGGSAPDTRTETTRLEERAALLNSVSNANAAAQQRQNTLLQAAQQAQKYQEADTARALQNAIAQRLSLLQSQDRAAEELRVQTEQDALDNAYTELNTFGRILTQQSADALGVPVGTRLPGWGSKSGGGSGSGEYPGQAEKREDLRSELNLIFNNMVNTLGKVPQTQDERELARKLGVGIRADSMGALDYLEKLEESNMPQQEIEYWKKLLFI